MVQQKVGFSRHSFYTAQFSLAENASTKENFTGEH